VLIVDDEVDHAEVMAEALRRPAAGGHVCTIVHDVPRAVDELRHGQFDIIVTDLRMPSSAGKEGVSADGGNAGFVVLDAARKLQPHALAIMVTAHGDAATARQALKLHNAYDFIEKPLDLDVLREIVGRAAEQVLMAHEAEDAGVPELVTHEGFDGIIAGSEPMRRILATVRAVAPSNIPVLITGESGTGKELIAQAIHKLSPRSKNRFVAFNCAGQSESLLEDALFGHVRGAFTGAEKEREGVFEYASGGAVPPAQAGSWSKGGTLFLDEIGDMPLTMQAKLLRTLENAEVVRLGSNEPRKVDVRFVSATNKDLGRIVEGGGGGGSGGAGAPGVNASAVPTFRQDLFYRIKGAHIHLPPLRDRREDIPRITRHAIARFAATMLPPGTPPPAITDAAMMRLTAYGWPGNVRQLLNVVQNMVVMAIGEGAGSASAAVTLDVRHIPDEVRTADDAASGADDALAALDAAGGPGPGASLAGTSLEQIEKRAIRETLRLTAGNREQAAKLLGIGERTLYRKLKEYGLR
jgi:two-component system response regulator HydG